MKKKDVIKKSRTKWNEKKSENLKIQRKHAKNKNTLKRNEEEEKIKLVSQNVHKRGKDIHNLYILLKEENTSKYQS